MHYLYTRAHNFESLEIFSVFIQQHYNDDEDYRVDGSTRVFYIRDGMYATINTREEIIKNSNMYSYNDKNYRLIYSNEKEQNKEINNIILRFNTKHILRTIFR